MCTYNLLLSWKWNHILSNRTCTDRMANTENCYWIQLVQSTYTKLVGVSSRTYISFIISEVSEIRAILTWTRRKNETLLIASKSSIFVEDCIDFFAVTNTRLTTTETNLLTKIYLIIILHLFYSPRTEKKTLDAWKKYVPFVNWEDIGQLMYFLRLCCEFISIWQHGAFIAVDWAFQDI